MTQLRTLLYGSALMLIVAAVYLMGVSTQSVGAANPAGYPSNIATTSNPAVGTTAAVLFATSTCSTRIITTYASPVMLTFSDRINQTPTGTFGHLQAASTTKEYDASLYGCGLFKAYSFTAQSITVSETR